MAIFLALSKLCCTDGGGENYAPIETISMSSCHTALPLQTPELLPRDPREIEVYLDQSFEVSYDYIGAGAVVVDLNEMAARASGLALADVIVEADGERTLKGIEDKLAQGTPIMTKVLRPVEYDIEVERIGGAKFGAVLNKKGGRTLLVQQIKEGIINTWNKTHPEQQVEAGDRIVQINGNRGDTSKLMQAIAADTILKIVISRKIAPVEAATGRENE